MQINLSTITPLIEQLAAKLGVAAAQRKKKPKRRMPWDVA